MKRLSLGGLYEYGLLAVMLLIVLHALVSVIAGQILPDHSILFKAWKELALAGLAAIAVCLINRRHLWTQLLRDRLIQLSLAFIALHLIIGAAFVADTFSLAAGLMIDLRFIVMFLLMYVLLHVRPESLKRVRVAAVSGAVIVIGFGLLQIVILPDDILGGIGYSKQTIAPYVTIDSNPDFVRINSTLRGPNPLGALMVVYAALAIAYMVRRKPFGYAQIGTLIGSVALLFASYSRSAYVAAVIAGMCVMAVSKKVSKRVMVFTVGAFLAVAGLLALVSTTDWFSNVVLHEDPESTVVSKSNHEHVESLENGLRRVASQPLGAGIGSTGSASLYDQDDANDLVIENYYFFVAHESGWLGLAVFVSLFGMVLIRLWRQRSDWQALGLFASGIGLAAAALVLPVWADDTVAIVWWGLAGAIIGSTGAIIGSRHESRTRQ